MRGNEKKFFSGEFSCRHREITDFFITGGDKMFSSGGVNLGRETWQEKKTRHPFLVKTTIVKETGETETLI